MPIWFTQKGPKSALTQIVLAGTTPFKVKRYSLGNAPAGTGVVWGEVILHEVIWIKRTECSDIDNLIGRVPIEHHRKRTLQPNQHRVFDWIARHPIAASWFDCLRKSQLGERQGGQTFWRIRVGS